MASVLGELEQRAQSEPTARVTTQDMLEAVGRVARGVGSLEQDLVQLVDANSEQFWSGFQYAGQVRSPIDTVAQTLAHVQEVVATPDTGLAARANALFTGLDDVSSALTRQTELVACVDRVAGYAAARERAVATSSDNMHKCAGALLALQDALAALLSALPHAQPSSTFLSMLRGDVDARESTIRSAWLARLDACVVVEPRSITLPDGDASNAVADALHQLGWLEPHLSVITTRIVTDIVAPALANTAALVSETPHSLSVAAVDAAASDAGADAAADVIRPLPLQALKRIRRIIDFVLYHLVPQSLHASFAAGVWSAAMPLLRDGLCEECVPTTSASLAAWQAEVVAPMRDWLSDSANIDTDAAAPLLAWTSDQHRVFVAKVRAVTLQQVRAVLTKPDSWSDLVDVFPHAETDSEPDTDALFPTVHCTVSAATVEVAECARAVLEDATAAPAACQLPLVDVARSVIDLYRAIVPSLHVAAIADVVVVAALFHNSCIFLARECALLGPRVAPRLSDAAARAACSFLDVAPRLLAVAAASLRQHAVSMQRDVVEAVRSGADDRAIALAQRLREHLTPLLPRHVLQAMLTGIADAVAASIVFAVLAVQDVSVDESQRLSFQISRLSAVLAPARTSDAPHWQRMQQLAVLLDAKLTDVQQQFRDARLSAFTVAELRHLVLALWSDTPGRAACLDMLR